MAFFFNNDTQIDGDLVVTGTIYGGSSLGVSTIITNPVADTRNVISGDVSTRIALGVKTVGDANNRFQVRSDGRLSWGMGSAPTNASIYSPNGSFLTFTAANWPYWIIIDGANGGGGAGFELSPRADEAGAYEMYVDASSEGMHVYSHGTTSDILLLTKDAGGTSKEGFKFGASGDVNLYRDAADVLKTNDSFQVNKEDGILSIDAANFRRIGFTKKAGFGTKLTFANDSFFAVAVSSADNIDAANTFTDKFTISGVDTFSYQRLYVQHGMSSGIPHLSLGKASATSGQISAAIQFTGYGVEHGYLRFKPNSTVASETFEFMRSGGDDATAGTLLFSIRGDKKIKLESGGSILFGDGTEQTTSSTTTMPPGVVAAFAAGAGAVPVGWLLCDGSVVSRTTYASLFAVISTQFNTGGEAGTDFRLPNLKGRVPVGLDGADTDWDVLGEIRGAKTHALIIGELAAHTHPPGAGTAFVESGISNVGSGTGFDWGTVATTGSTGSGIAHNNLQPSIVLNYIIKT